MTISLDRRKFVLASAALTATIVIPARTFAQEASPAATGSAPMPSDDGIDVPVLQVAFGAGGVTVSPAEIPAGLVRMLASSAGSDDQEVLVFRVADDQDVSAVLEMAKSDDPPPDWFWTTFFPGGVWNDSHDPSVAEGFITLEAGNYIILDVVTHSDAAFTVTGEAGTLPDIPATVQVTAEDSMTFTGLEEPVPAGRQLWRFDNAGKLRHSIDIYSTPEGATAEGIQAIFEAMFSGTPTAGNPLEGYGDSPMSTMMLSGGGTNWFYLDLEPGSYAAMCTSFDDMESPPHFLMGMIVTFTVK